MKMKLMTLLMVAAALAAQGASSFEKADYRFVTWNIWGWGENVGYTPDKREVKAIQAARAWNADVIAMQEVSPNWWKSAFFKELSQDYGVVDGGDWTGVKHNPNPLMYRKSRLELLFSGRECYHFKLDYSKGYTWAAFKDKATGAKFITFSTHYWWKETGAESAYIRYVNSQRLIEGMERLRSILPAPVIGGGDFNCRAADPRTPWLFGCAEVRRHDRARLHNLARLSGKGHRRRLPRSFSDEGKYARQRARPRVCRRRGKTAAP